uniref:Cortactin-binding protein-2 N-terminal domain-containing protein n=1 Tax=Photinus pyralis TaxID=7054 RepID=A0A1Y1LH36_PHOPY
MASNNNQNGWLSGLGIGFGPPLSSVPEQQSSSTSDMNQFEQLDRSNAGSNTLKRNPKMELTKTDLLKLLTYFEGEIQARDITIAALKSERLKQVVNVGRYRPIVMTDPYTALLRDSIADSTSSKPPHSEKDMAAAAEQQLQALEQLALQQRRAHQHMVNILKDAEVKHKKVIQELEEEKCKHEHDTAQGDDITYGLEMERTRLRQELEMERTARKKLEKELKRQVDLADEEKARQKQIVLLLIAERKKIIVKYIEERKRSEDLAQILSEEKSRIDTMAEGLEEESKKSLQMEAELEKQVHIFEADKKIVKVCVGN